MGGRKDELREYRRKRDFSRTAEPRGADAPGTSDELVFVVQKHAASHLHYDLRLQIGNTMKSWAVPKGPSIDPTVKRLAMEVEDHPIEYNDFEGTIPQGEYGGGTVMLWDRGTYEPEERKASESRSAAALRGYRRGKLSFTLRGERLRGSFALVRTHGDEGGGKPKWLLIKQDDPHADPAADITETLQTSVATGRTMDEIAAGKGGGRTWRSNREKSAPTARRASPPPPRSSDDLGFEPMLAQSGSGVPAGDEWVFEPKYDGIRVLAYATPDQAALVTRNGHDKAKQFPEVAEAIRALSGDLEEPVVLDGEIVALQDGDIVRFEALQARMHLENPAQVERLAAERPSALVAFDLLLLGDAPQVQQPWEDRRRLLEEVLDGRTGETIRISEVSTDVEELQARAERGGWEGLVAKRRRAPYRPGKRSRDWLKLKMENRQEFVVGGWTEPRQSRQHLGAILLGYYDEAGDLIYAGHTGAGFSREGLEDMHRRLKRLERKTSPFKEAPATNEKPHWTTPRVVVEVKFNEWTREGKLRQPTFLGIREDKDPRSVVREAGPVERKPPRRSGRAVAAPEPPPVPRGAGAEALTGPVVDEIRRLAQKKTAGGVLEVGPGRSLEVSSLRKVFFPRTRHTKGDLLEYYAGMADHVLPWMDGRPLVLKRFPNGIDGESFYQQAAPEEAPEGVRVEMVRIGDGEPQPRLVGGNLITLLYTVQLGAISYDPWHSRVHDLDSADYTVLDLDPGPGASFSRVVRVARWVHEEMEELGLHGSIKTSGSSGLHVYLPLPAGTPLDAATLTAQIVATRVAQRHPKEATVKRMRRDRPRGTVYVDYLQNILGKTVAGVYSVRAKPGATVSTPIAWDELTDDLDMREFTLETVPRRVAEKGDLWTAGMAQPNDLHALLERVG